MWHFSVQGLPATGVATGSCGLLPHIFTLACRIFNEDLFVQAKNPASADILCGTISFPIFIGKPAIHRCIALCCPDFPLPAREAITGL
jgi:hypothetical protein